MTALEKHYSGAPFGVQTARFDVAGVHPANKRPASFTQVPYDRKLMTELSRSLGPAKYDTTIGAFSDDAVERQASGPGWARQYESEQIAALPHLLHKEIWESKRIVAKKLGPGSHNIKDFLELSEEKPRSTRGVCGTREARFREPYSERTPGPGTYGEGGVPHSAIEEKALRSTSTVGLLDAAASGKRDLPTVGCHIGPGTYNFRSFAEELTERRVSKRGPYDLFSIDRNQPIITGHYAKQKGVNLGPGQYDSRSFVDDLMHAKNRRKGKFSTIEQHPQRGDRVFGSTLSQRRVADDSPGPASYMPHEDETRPKTENQPGFLSGSSRQDRRAMRFFTRNFNPVGAGRYEVQKFHEAEHRNGHESVFVSKTGRLTQSQEKAFREQIRSKDVHPKDKQFLVNPERPPYYYQQNLELQFSSVKSRTIA